RVHGASRPAEFLDFLELLPIPVVGIGGAKQGVQNGHEGHGWASANGRIRGSCLRKSIRQSEYPRRPRAYTGNKPPPAEDRPMHRTYRVPALALVALHLAGHGEVEGEGGERRHRRRDDFPDRLPRTKKKKGRGEGPLEETEVRNEKVVAKTRL